MQKVSTFHPMKKLRAVPVPDNIYEQSLVIREEERKSIAREIHDGIGQALIAIAMDVSLLKQKLTKTNQKASRFELSQDVNRIANQIDTTLVALRTFIAELRPQTVDKLGLRQAIEWQAREFQLRFGIPVEIRSDLETITMRDPNDATALFRIFQEVLTNVGRHAKASRVYTTMRKDREFFMMQIKDNGRGINETDLQKNMSYGLLGLKERVFLLRGEVEIQGVPDQGTTVTVRIPHHLCGNGS
jgi:signal transduction histidine kinase